MITEGTLFIVKTAEGYVVCEATNYTYLDPATAKAFARDKWGQPEPRMATEVESVPTTSGYEKDQTPMSVSPDWKSDGTGFRE
jgi:hypothetical protein